MGRRCGPGRWHIQQETRIGTIGLDWTHLLKLACLPTFPRFLTGVAGLKRGDYITLPTPPS